MFLYSCIIILNVINVIFLLLMLYPEIRPLTESGHPFTNPLGVEILDTVANKSVVSLIKMCFIFIIMCMPQSPSLEISKTSFT